ncbi:unnamed protein product [Oikopleura dioica]|uniref:Uncharacterized protein n=1 Tax=Oikopleura dioica TaxID=34765 RepID=E4XT90_OIKDI|nr:unnamed protein product [Oikopleura dioica]
MRVRDAAIPNCKKRGREKSVACDAFFGRVRLLSILLFLKQASKKGEIEYCQIDRPPPQPQLAIRAARSKLEKLKTNTKKNKDDFKQLKLFSRVLSLVERARMIR